jgi:uncharacterized protein YbbC (DUF1343 family)
MMQSASIASSTSSSASSHRLDTGLDRLVGSSALQAKLGGARARIGLLAHPASVDRRLVHISDILAELGVKPALIFGPEHGYGGEAQDMIGVDDAKDERGIPIKSLYGTSYGDLIPKESDVKGLDLVLVDLQDIGTRYYTFQWTVVLAMRVCAKLGVRMMILDRPNPIGGARESLEGRALEPAFRSFVGLEPIAVRTSLTYGEVCAWRADVERAPKELLEIVGVRGIDRAAHATSWDRAFVLPSPNMPTYETALVYPGGCLLEGTNLSDGRGQTRPFEITGAPWIDGTRLANELNALGLAGMRARALTFLPTFHKHAAKVCGGVQIHVTDARAFRPVATYLALITLAHHQSPEKFAFRTEKYEYVDDIPAFDLLTGNAEARTMIAAGGSAMDVVSRVAPVGALEHEIHAQAISAAERRGI